MIKLTRNIILKFVRDNFNPEDIKLKNNEIQLNSPFKRDRKYHLGISLHPEKLGVWNDFKPPRMSGDFIEFVMLVKNFKNRAEAIDHLLKLYIKDINIMEIINSENNTENKTTEEYKPIKLPPFVVPILKNGITTSMFAKTYFSFLKSRNISPKTIEERQLMYGFNGEFNGYLVIPFFNDKKEIIYYQARKIINYNKNPKYKNAPSNEAKPVAYNVFTNSPNIILVEGVFDALRVPYESVALLTNQISDNTLNLLFKKERKEIIVALDNFVIDKAGKEGTLKTLERLKNYIALKNLKTRVLLFNWTNKKFVKYKDFSRIPFELNYNIIEENSEDVNEISDLKIELFSIIENIK